MLDLNGYLVKHLQRNKFIFVGDLIYKILRRVFCFVEYGK